MQSYVTGYPDWRNRRNFLRKALLVEMDELFSTSQPDIDHPLLKRNHEGRIEYRLLGHFLVLRI
jgi:hypothetical protein